MSQNNAKLDGDVESQGSDQQEGRDAKDHLAVVGIGASAGGVGALQRFFKNVPADTRIAYVVVMHLSPEHESHLQDVLQHVSPVPVTQVSERTSMQSGHVYVIPPDKNLEITDGHLIVTDFDEPRGQRAPIDVFFRTLAHTHPDGIGIVLSGGGTDGTMGMKAIKEHGGVLMVQLPDEAEYDAMPKSAIATGLIDFVLSADQLAAKVEELAANADVGPLPSEDEIGADEEATLRKILVQLQARTGHDFSGYKRNTLFRRIARRMRVCQVDSLEDYLEYLRRNQSEAAALQKDFLISVTDFFRDPNAFATLGETAIEDLVERCPNDEEMRIWVPGCATGEEVYSLAILLLEAADRYEKAPSFQIFATDLDEEALAYAREGRYPSAIVTDISEERLRRFFVTEGPNYRVKRELRDMVLFATHDLLKDPPFSQIALISCRNLLIYLQRDLQSKVFELFHYALESDGYLFLGGSESAESAPELFRSIDKHHRIYQAKPAPARMHHRLPALPLSANPRTTRQVHRRAPTVEIPRPASDFETHEQSLEAHAPPSLLVDSNFDIVHLSENAGRYLQMPGGSPTSNAIKLVSTPLGLDLRSGLHEAFESQMPTLSPAVTTELDGQRRAVRVYVSPVPGEEEDSELALVLFVETDPAQAGGSVIDGEETDDARAEHLAREVTRLRERLQITSEKAETQQEELKATNEELQSINEEYKSTLEELETSKEELQSVNEELKTVNTELKEKVEELSRANDDLQNLMAATDVATLFVDRQLQIQLYTPALEQIFNIRPLDEGRPLSHLTHRLDTDDMEAKASEVLRTLVPHEETLEHADGRTYLMRILPYRTIEDRIEGVILTFVDITAVKETREDLRRTRQHYELLIDSVDEYAIFTTDEEGRVVSWNPGAVRLFGYKPDEILGEPSSLVFTPEDRSEGIPQAEMGQARDSGQASNERWHVRKDGARFWGSGTLSALYDDEHNLRGFAKVLRDNTQRREAEQQLRRMNETLEQQVEERTRQVRKLASDLTMAQQKERRRLSQILHDSLQQRLYGIQMKMTFVTKHAKSGDTEALIDYAQQAYDWLDEAINTTRQLSVDLSPPVLGADGLTDAIDWLKSHMAELHGLEVVVEADHPFYVEDRDMLVLLFHMVRELLFNVVKHGDTDRATVGLDEEDDGIVIRVHDEGRGFERDPTLDDGASDGFGLSSIRERLELFGGRFDIDTSPGEGTTAVIHAPTHVQPKPAS